MNKKKDIPKDVSEAELLKYSEAYFANRVFGYIIAEHHSAMIKHMQTSNATLILAPRGCGKTKICDISHIAFEVINKPNSRILLLSDTHKHATRFLATIKNVLQSSPIVKQHYGNVVGDKWTENEVTTELRTDASITEATVTATGMYGSFVTSGHFTEVVCDDLINFDNSRSALQRDKTEDWFKTTLLPTLLPDAPIRVIGTRYGHLDLYHTLMETMGYKPLKLSAIIDEGTPNERSIWPELMPLKTKTVNGVRIKGLLDIKEDIGSLIFQMQYQNDTTLEESGSIFKYVDFKYYSNLHREGSDLYVEIGNQEK